MVREKRFKSCTRAGLLAGIVGAIVVILLVLASKNAWLSGAISPVLPAEGTENINLGPELPGRVLHLQEIVSNHGAAAIHFSKLITSCGCLKGGLQPATIFPGKSATLHLELVAHDFPGGELVTAMLRGNAGHRQIIRQYNISYSVHRMIRVTGPRGSPTRSYYLDLGALRVGAKPKPLTLTIVRGAYPGQWDTLKCSCSGMDLATRLKKTGMGRWRLALAPRSLMVLGSQSYMLRFSFYRKRRELRYHFSEPVNFTVRGPVEIEPDSIFFGAVPIGTISTQRLHMLTSVTSRTGSGRITSVRSTDPTRATATVIDSGKGIRATFRGIGLLGGARGRFLVDTEYHGERYRFRIDYLADVYGKRDSK